MGSSNINTRFRNGTLFAVLSILLLVTPLAQAQDEPENDFHGERARQVHLDFHTSEEIGGIGKQFRKEQFQEALRTGNVNSINIFAKGHHGWTYYPSKIGEQHPHLEFDLLKQQLAACHEIGVTAQAYVTVGWSAKDAREHPEWILWERADEPPATIEMRKKENPDGPFGWGWDLLSPEGDYKQHILDLTEELCLNYDLDGFWFDIVPVWNINYNPAAIQEMKSRGVDIEDSGQVRTYHAAKMNQFMAEIRTLVRELKPEASLFFNWSTHWYSMETYDYRFFDHNTKMDLEDLPTTWGGYDKFPVRAKYFSNFGKPVVAMSGKFHISWGEFGGFKSRDAILYEAAAMVSFGASANFGDQLHPSGEMEMTTYENIGYAYDYIKKIENYGVGAGHRATLALWMVSSNSSNEGMARMLLENQVNFVIGNNLQDWSDIRTMVIPGQVRFTKEQKAKVDDFVGRGGTIILIDRAGIDFQTGEFLFDVGADYLGPATADMDYTLVGEKLPGDLVRAPFLNYIPSRKVSPKPGTEVLAAIREPYFNRTLSHYSSHANTPFKLNDADHPAVIRNGNMVYISSDLPGMYYKNGAKVHRDLFNSVLDLVHVGRMLEVDLPSSGRANLLHQPEHSRYVAHLLYATPIQRGEVQVIEDLVPIHDTRVVIRVPEKVKTIRQIPEDVELELKRNTSGIEVVVPHFKCHTALVIGY